MRASERDRLVAAARRARHHAAVPVSGFRVGAALRTVDGRVFTGGGVTAGIDFAFTLMNEIAGPQHAQTVQLGLEYDPHPPFQSGSPASAPQAVKATADQRYAHRLAAFEEVLDRVTPRLGATAG